MNPAQSSELNKTQYIITFFAIVAITFGIYSNSIDNEFIDYWDDNTYVTGNALVKKLDFDNVKRIFSSVFWFEYYPVYTLSHSVDYYFWGLNPVGYHISNIFLHSLNAFFVFLIIAAISRKRLTAFIAVLLFVAHPSNVESVAYIAQRKNELAFFFMLTSFYLFIRREKGKHTLALYIASSLLFFLSILSKSTAIAFPLLLLIYDFCFTKKRLSEKLLDKIPYFIISCIGASITLLVFKDLHHYQNYDVPLYFRILTMLKAFSIYIGKLLVPINLNNFYFYNVSISAADWRVIVAAIVISITLYCAYKSYKKNPTLSFCIMWFFVCLLPVSNIVKGPFWLAERFMYLPLFAYSLFVATLFTKAVEKCGALSSNNKLRRNIAIGIVASMACFYMYGTVARNAVWQDSVTLWEDCATKNPQSSLSHAYLGGSYFKRGLKEKSRDECVKALQINPKRSNAWANLAYLELGNGNLDEAYKKIRLALLYEPDNYEAHNALGIFYMFTKKYDRAKTAFKRALELRPESIIDFVSIHNNLGITMQKQENYKQAAASFSEALKYNHNDFKSILNLAVMHAFYLNNKEQASYYLQKIETANQGNPTVQQVKARISQLNSGK